MLNLPVTRSKYAALFGGTLCYSIYGKNHYEICRLFKLSNETELDFVDRVDALVEALNWPLKYVEKFAAK